MTRKKNNIKNLVNSFSKEQGNIPIGPKFFGETFAESKTILASVENPSRTMGNNWLSGPLLDRYEQIYKGVMPFNMTSVGGNAVLSIEEYVTLCQKAYFNVAIFRNTIDTMTEFTNSEVLFKGGNEKSRKFFENWFNTKIKGHKFCDQWFREYYRSGNIFLYRIDADIDASTLKKIGTMYGSENGTENKLPVRYLLLNSAHIRCAAGLNFSDGAYFKVLTRYEIDKINHPITEEDREFAQAIKDNKEFGEALLNNTELLMPLDPYKIHIIFCKKQDYEPFVVPMFFPVLEDIDLKLQFKRMEKTLSRTVEYCTLLIKIGTEENPNPESLAMMQELYANESVGRVLIADGTTEMEFVIPDLNKVLGPEKYQQVNEDISNGLMTIFAGGSGGEKFSAASIKTKVFMERLKEARKAFLEDFLNPEIKRISQNLGFKSFPRATMAELDLNDQNLVDKVTIQLCQLGILTPDEALERIKTGYIPTPEESLESQKKFKPLKDEGYYIPANNGGLENEGGRPNGTTGTSPATRNPSPAGTSKASVDGGLTLFDINKVVETFKKTDKLYKSLELEAKKHFKVKTLNDNQKSVIDSLVPIILSNENTDQISKDVLKSYIAAPKMINDAAAMELDEIMAEHDTSIKLAAVLRLCKKDK